VAGTRVSLDSIVYGFVRGESPETIRGNFSTLTLEQVYGAITYYLGHRAEIDAYLKQSQAEWAEQVRREREAHPDWYKRMDEIRSLSLARR